MYIEVSLQQLDSFSRLDIPLLGCIVVFRFMAGRHAWFLYSNMVEDGDGGHVPSSLLGALCLEATSWGWLLRFPSQFVRLPRRLPKRPSKHRALPCALRIHFGKLRSAKATQCQFVKWLQFFWLCVFADRVVSMRSVRLSTSFMVRALALSRISFACAYNSIENR